MPSANKTTHYGFPQWAGNEYLKREDMNEAFAIADRELNRVEDALQSFDRLAETYGYTFTKQTNENNTVFTETVKSGSPVTAIRVTTKSFVDSFLQFRKQITIGENVTFFTEKKTADGWEGVVG